MVRIVTLARLTMVPLMPANAAEIDIRALFSRALFRLLDLA